MLYNEFDRFFKDRLKDYSSPVHAGIWRRVRSDWGRRRLFRTRWVLTGGVAVVVVAVVIGYFTVKAGRPVVGHAAGAGAASAEAAGVTSGAVQVKADTVEAAGVGAGVSEEAVDSDARVGTSHFAKSIAANSVERTPASSTGLMSGQSQGRTLSQGGMDGAESGGRAAGGTGGASGTGGAGVGGRKVGGAGVGGRKTDGAGVGDGQGQGRVEKGRRGAGQSQGSEGQMSGGRESEGQGYRGREGLPSLAQLSSRAAIYAKPIKLSPVVSSRQRSGAALDDRPGNLHLDIYGSPDIPTKQFALSYTAGARMTMLITQHFFVSAGLQYSKANVKKDSATALLYPRYFNNIDLPVLIGYTTGNDRFRFSVDGGVIFNLFSHAASPVGWGWPNRTGPSAYLGLDFARAVSDRISLFAEPYGRCLFTDYKSLFPSLTYTGGVLIGIRYNFMRR